jgi:uncharacterized protein involved in tolerance to divalent cations
VKRLQLKELHPYRVPALLLMLKSVQLIRSAVLKIVDGVFDA